MQSHLLHLKVANGAKNYAQSFIKKSFTKLATKNYRLNANACTLRDAIDDFRRIGHSNPNSLYLRIDPDESIYSFEESIQQTKKYSIGNCCEYVELALEYILGFNEKYPTHKIFAEGFEIENGDHEFLVLGRLQNSDPGDPLTWGDNAIICDPWSDLVYPAKQYKEFLKNYEYQPFKKMHHLEKINNSHILATLTSLNTRYLEKKNSKKYRQEMQNFFQMKINLLNEIVSSYRIELKRNTVFEKMDKKDRSYQIIYTKLAETERLLDFLNEAKQFVFKNSKKNDYYFIKEQLQNTLRQVFEYLNSLYHFTPMEKKILRPQTTFRLFCCRNQQQKIFNELQDAILAVQNDINRLQICSLSSSSTHRSVLNIL